MRYLSQYRHMHGQLKFPGYGILPHCPAIADLIAEHRARTILDYGCGEGRQWRVERVYELLGIKEPRLYDPAVPFHSQMPDGKWDGIICTDVLCHVPEPGELLEVTRHLAQLSTGKGFVFVAVGTRPSSITFGDGTNVRVTLHPMEWWAQYLAPHFAQTRLVLAESP